MDCEKCPIKDECNEEKLNYFEGKRFFECVLIAAARGVTGSLKYIKEEFQKSSPEKRERFLRELELS